MKCLKKHTQKALISSIISLLICCSMLISSTFAWFTASVSSDVNLVKSGDLDIVLECKTVWNDAWKTVDETTKIFQDHTLFEPGHTEIVYLRIANAGSLALKYQLGTKVGHDEVGSTNIEEGTFKLSDVLDVGAYVMDEFDGASNAANVKIPTMFGTWEEAITSIQLYGTKFEKISDNPGGIILTEQSILSGEDTAQIVVLVLTMPSDIGNVANHRSDMIPPKMELGIQFLATQCVYEKDGFDGAYDQGAEYPIESEDEWE